MLGQFTKVLGIRGRWLTFCHFATVPKEWLNYNCQNPFAKISSMHSITFPAINSMHSITFPAKTLKLKLKLKQNKKESQPRPPFFFTRNSLFTLSTNIKSDRWSFLRIISVDDQTKWLISQIDHILVHTKLRWCLYIQRFYSGFHTFAFLKSEKDIVLQCISVYLILKLKWLCFTVFSYFGIYGIWKWHCPKFCASNTALQCQYFVNTLSILCQYFVNTLFYRVFLF